MVVIVLLNIAAYLAGKRDGRIYGRQNTIELLLAVAPDEMNAVMAKFDQIDPDKFAMEYVMKKKTEGK